MTIAYESPGFAAAERASLNEPESRDRESAIKYEAAQLAKDAVSGFNGSAPFMAALDEAFNYSGAEGHYTQPLRALIDLIRAVPFTLSHLTPTEQMQALREQAERVLYEAAKDALTTTEEA